MQFKCFFKRVAPFFLTFSLGLLVASFFVTVAAPNFNFKRRNFRERQRENYNLRIENEQLKRRVRELEIRQSVTDLKFNPDLLEPVAPPPPPAPPRVR